MNTVTLIELYETNKISSRLYNSLRVNCVTDEDETGGEFTLFELKTLLDTKGIGNIFRTKYTSRKTLNELNDLMVEFTGIDYMKYARGESSNDREAIETMRNETLKLTKLLMGSDVDVESVKEKISLLMKLSKKIS